MKIKELILTADVFELSQGLKEKKFTSLEITEAFVNRCENLNPKINAFITLLNEQAIEKAKKADEEIVKGNINALTGIPIGVKDNICTKGVKTTCASKMLEDFVPPYDATSFLKLKNSGAVLLGKTNMDEFAMGSSSETSHFGSVKNPFDLTRVAGGSSGGSAAAVSAGMCAAALGSDTGGSIRQPAAFCGVVGLKPTYSTVSRYGLVAFASSLDQIGPIAKSSRDCGIILNAIAGKDENDATTTANPYQDYLSKIGADLKGMVIGLPKEFLEIELQDEIRRNFFANIELLKSLGAEIKLVSLPSLKYAVPAYYLISSAEAASNLSRFDGIKYGHRSNIKGSYSELIKASRQEGFGWEVKRRIMLGNYALSSGFYDEYYKKAVKVRAQIKAEYDELFKVCDLILTPTCAETAHKFSITERPSKIYKKDILTVTANIAGLPSISIPVGFDKKGLPIGLSLTGKAFDEATIISVADAIERLTEKRRPLL